MEACCYSLSQEKLRLRHWHDSGVLGKLWPVSLNRTFWQWVGKQPACWGKQAWRSSNNRLAWEQLYQHMQIIWKYPWPPAGCPIWMGDLGAWFPALGFQQEPCTWLSTPGPWEVHVPRVHVGWGGRCVCVSE